MGWGNSPSKGFGFLFEAGLIFTGAAKYNLTGSGTVQDSNGTTYDLASDPTIKAQLDKEKAKVEKDVSQLDFLPILQLGLNYRF